MSQVAKVVKRHDFGVSRRKTAFTLIELLVVISIISMLVAILLPALGKARDAARTTTCATQVKQVSFMVALYGPDYRDWIPYSRATQRRGYAGGPTLTPAKYWWFSNLALSGYVNGSSVDLPTNYGTVAPEAYLRAMKLFGCPSYQSNYIWANGVKGVTSVGSDYGLNGHIAGYLTYTDDMHGLYDDTFRHKFSSVLKTSKAIMVGDIAYHANQSGSLQNNSDQFQFDHRHNGASNISFFDGHVETFREPFGKIQGYGYEDHAYWAADGVRTTN